MPGRVALTLPAGPAAADVARRAFAPFADLLPPGWFFDASVCLAELVSHAVAAAPAGPRAELALTIALEGGVLRVEIERPPGAEALDGLLLADLASRHGAGERLWFECDVAPGEDARAPRATD